MPKEWEIWRARFDFSDGKGCKHSPVLLLGERKGNLLVTLVTDATDGQTLEHDCPIRDWRTAGLKKPSVARVDRIAEVPADCLEPESRMGKLSSVDANTVSLALVDALRK